MASKYALLESHLANAVATAGTVTLTIADIEQILGFRLPPSAYRYAAWWSNTDSHTQSLAWRRAGYDVVGVSPGDWVWFRRIEAGKEGCAPEFRKGLRPVLLGAGSEPIRVFPKPADAPTVCHPADTIALVSCVKSKQAHPCAARDLYVSTWFHKARAYVEGLGIPWYILSAEHGLVPPEQVLAPYERTLEGMPVSQRRAWAEKVGCQLSELISPDDQVVVLAGAHYREYLMPTLNRLAARVQVPMEGMRIGEQLSWLGRHHV